MPYYDEEVKWYVGIFQTLSRSRSSNGFGPNPIILSEIYIYLSNKILINDMNTCIRVLQEMDKEYILYSDKSNN